LLAVQLRVAGIGMLALALLFGVAPFAQPGVRAATPRVAIIVGPVGSLTDLYRADAENAAAAARLFTDDVVTVYSPDATWAAAKAAMQGASIVVYLGHGNGFPSPYGRTLNPRTQNGLGLNPVAGGDDVAHQYFGEWHLARQVRLAPNAVVVLSHLCYASGNAEPGMPEGTLDVAQERVDNFAAGFLAAGAGAVVADAYLDPAYYVGSVLGGEGTIEGIWRAAPSFHDHVVAFPSSRSPGFTALLDPTGPQGEFYRSLVSRAALRADEVARGAALREDPGAPGADMPAPALTGPTVTEASLRGIPVAGSSVELRLAFGLAGTVPAEELRAGIRWTPLQLSIVEATPQAESGSPSPVAPPGPAAASDPTAPASPVAPSAAAPDAPSALPGSPASYPSPSADSAASLPLADPPDPAGTLVTPESPGDVVVLAESRASAKGLQAKLTVPSTPGLYRLVTTLHGADDVALDAASQGRIPALVVHVTGSLSATITAPERVAAITGSALELPIAVLNSGSVPWGTPAGAIDPGDPLAAPRRVGSEVVGYWLRLDASGGDGGAAPARARLEPAPGSTERATLHLVAPGLPGEFLLVLDVVSGRLGSLAVAGSSPVVVRVTVTLPPADPGTTGPEATAAPVLAPASRSPEPRAPRSRRRPRSRHRTSSPRGEADRRPALRFPARRRSGRP
jgi:hypothetical protein